MYWQCKFKLESGNLHKSKLHIINYYGVSACTCIAKHDNILPLLSCLSGHHVVVLYDVYLNECTYRQTSYTVHGM